MTDTVRQTVIAALEEKFRGIVAGEPAADPYTIAWGQVTNSEPSTGDPRVNTLWITVPQEASTMGTDYYDKEMRASLEFSVVVPKAYAENPGAYIEIVIGEIQRMLYSDRQVSGTALGLLDGGNETDVAGTGDVYVRGAVFALIRYRHSQIDPRRGPGNAPL